MKSYGLRQNAAERDGVRRAREGRYLPLTGEVVKAQLKKLDWTRT